MIDFKNTSIGYKNELFNIESASLEKGQIYTLIGRNGIGKSTLLKTLCKEISLFKGEINIDDKSIDNLEINQLPNYISFVPSKFPEVNYLKVWDYIGLGRSKSANYFGHLSDEETKKIDNAIKLFNIHHLQNSFTSEISDGEKQIVAIAKAYIQDTPIIILDEPTAFLDYANKRKILQLLIGLCQNHQKTILMSTHDIDILLEEDQINYLLIHQENHNCVLHTRGVTKDFIIKTCF